MSTTDIIIVHYGDLHITSQAIDSLVKNVTFRNIIVVNNDPAIKIGEELATLKNVIYIDQGKNTGFAAGVNKGIDYALKNKAGYIVLFNNDACANSDFVTKLQNIFSEKENAGIVSPVIAFDKSGKEIYDTGGKINNYTGKTYHQNTDTKIAIQTKQVAYVSGCCMMIDTQVINDIGKFDERFFLYYEDVDFCLRAREAGYAIYSTPDAMVYHGLSQSVGKNSNTAKYHLIRSGNKFGHKYKKLFPLHRVFMMYQSFVFFVRAPFSLGSIIRGWV